MNSRKETYNFTLPSGIEIEPTNLCDLKCPLCPSGNGKIDEWRLPRGMMNLRQFKDIIDQVKNFVKYIVLWGLGEPTLVPDLDLMIDYAAGNKISVITSIHGNHDKKLNRKLMEAEPYKIIFAIDGLSQETYGIYRQGGNFEKALSNLKDCVNIKKETGQKYPLIYWQFIVMKHNEKEISDLKKMAEKIGVDGLMLKKYASTREDKFRPENPEYIRHEPEEEKYKCKFLFDRPMIFFNGDVSACSHDFRMKHIMGNIFKEPFADIWNNDRFRKFRHSYFDNSLFECQGCRARSYADHFIEYTFPGKRRKG